MIVWPHFLLVFPSFTTCKPCCFLPFLEHTKSISFLQSAVHFLCIEYSSWDFDRSFLSIQVLYVTSCGFSAESYLKESPHTVSHLTLITLFSSKHLLLLIIVIFLFVFLHLQEYKLHENRDLTCLVHCCISTLTWVTDSWSECNNYLLNDFIFMCINSVTFEFITTL